MKTLKKRALMLLVLAVVMSANLSAQISKNIVDMTKQWNVVVHCWNGYMTYSYRVSNEDTLIADKVYYSLQMSYDYDTITNTWSKWFQRDWIREDSGRVYIFTNREVDTNGSKGWTMCKSQNTGAEYLLYDFNLQVGDSIGFTREYTFWGGYSESMFAPVRVTKVDSIEIDGEFYKRISFKDSVDFMETWIEGIGSDKGLLESFNLSYVLLCVKENEDVAWYNSPANESWNPIEENTCYMSVGIQDIQNSGTTIYPSATKGTITITATNFPIDISIFDIHGRCVKQDVITGNTQIDITNLANGIYTIICNQNGRVFTQKIIKL